MTTRETSAPKSAESLASQREVITALESELASGSSWEREKAICQLLDLGRAALPALPAIVRAIADANEIVATKALAIIERLYPTVPEQFTGLWLRLHSLEDKDRLAASEELGNLLPTLVPGRANAGSDETESVEEDAVPEPFEMSLPPEYHGKWIAWDEKQEQVVAADDTYLGLLHRVEQMGLVDPQIERAPVVDSALAEAPLALLEGESPDILEDLRQTIPDTDEWLDTPNTRLWFKKPRELLGTPQERQLRDLLRGIWSGVTS